MRIESRTLLVFLACILLTAACGQKGPLYLPGRSSTIESMVPEQQPATAEESEESEESEDDDEEESNNINY